MKKKPVGWFTDPATGVLVVILAKDGESPQDAILRVATEHAIAATEVATVAPAVGAGANVEIDVPHSAEARSPDREYSRDARREPDRENPAHGVARFSDRSARASSLAPIEPPIVESLLPRTGRSP
jgi:hypothetical protein